MNKKKFTLLTKSPSRHCSSTTPQIPTIQAPPQKPRMNEAPLPCPQDNSATQREPKGNEKPKPPQKPRKCNPVLSFFKSTANQRKTHPCPYKQWPPVLHIVKAKGPPEEESNFPTPRGSNRKNTLIPQML